MALWRRRPSRGRHALGAAVRSLPAAAPPPVPTPLRQVAGATPPQQQPDVAAAVPPPPPLRQVAGATPPQQRSDAGWDVPEVQPRGPRVELTFRDGSTAALDATAARALDEIAQVLTRRD